MVAPRASRLRWIVVLLLGQQFGWAFGASTCTTIIVSGVGELDGTYEKGSSAFDPYLRAAGTIFIEIYPFTSSDVSGWYIAVTNTVVYRTYDTALHPADISLDWVECDGSSYCDDEAALSQPVIACEEVDTIAPTPPPTRIETPSPSPAPTAALTCSSGYVCASTTDTVLEDVVCSTNPCNDDDCCETRETIAPTPSPIRIETPSPSPPRTTAAPEAKVTPQPVAPPTDSRPATSAPEAAAAADDDDSGDDRTTGIDESTKDLIVGVLSTLISSAILGAATYTCVVIRRRKHTAATRTGDQSTARFASNT